MISFEHLKALFSGFCPFILGQINHRRRKEDHPGLGWMAQAAVQLFVVLAASAVTGGIIVAFSSGKVIQRLDDIDVRLSKVEIAISKHLDNGGHRR